MRSPERPHSLEDEIEIEFGRSILRAFERAKRELGGVAIIEKILEKMQVLLKEAGIELDSIMRDRIREILRVHGF